MGGAGFILAINLAVAALLAASFAALALFDRRRSAAWWMAASYLSGGLALSIEFLIAGFDLGRAGVVLNFAAFLLTLVLFNAAVASRFGIGAPWKLMGALFALSLLCNAVISAWPQGSVLRMGLYQFPYAAMQGIGAWIAWRHAGHDRLGRGFGALLGLSALHFQLKPVAALLADGAAFGPQTYLQSIYAMISLSVSTVFAFALALCALALLVRDTLAEAAGRSETDALSGLLNRGGFERHGVEALARARAGNLPVSLVLADLDGFKAVNDTLGHAGGDRVISGFAGFLRQSADRNMMVARIGGEEFAVILPGAGLSVARLWAEGARTAFSGLALEGLPAERRFTASFGVAEGMAGEPLAALLERADQGLYAAKAAGRDCVRLARLRPPDLPAELDAAG